MKLLHVVSSMDPKAGGVSQAVRTIIEGLSTENLVNEVVCTDTLQTYSVNDNFTTHFVGPGKSSWHYTSKLLTWLNENVYKYDAILVHGLWQYHTYAVYQATRKVDKKLFRIFVMPHGMLDPWFQRAKGRRIKAIRNWFFWKFIENRIINKSNGLFFTCETEKLLAKETFFPYTPKTEHVVGMGVQSPPAFTEQMQIEFAKKCDTNGRPYILFLSRINVKKGVDLLINAYLSLKAAGWKLPVLVIAGPDQETPYGQQMLQLASVDQDIIFPGMLAGDAKWGAFYGCETFVLPSHQENFGIAVVEAMACGKPVLISDQVNIYREIEEGKGGIVATDSLEGAKQLLAGWVSLDAMEKLQMAENAKELYASLYSVAPAARRLKEALS